MKARLAESLGADGVMVIPPYYSTPTPDELFEHYRRIGEAVSFPIMIYNNPATSNVDLTPEIVARLALIDNVRYIKESTLEVTRVRDIIELWRCARTSCHATQPAFSSWWPITETKLARWPFTGACSRWSRWSVATAM
jgi:dihydrodipicolinate synthase/N-acetylneuraminate lyase